MYEVNATRINRNGKITTRTEIRADKQTAEQLAELYASAGFFVSTQYI